MDKEKCAACPGMINVMACGSGMLGTLFLLLAGVSRVFGFTPMNVGPHSFAAASFLLFMMSITIHICKMVCFGACKS
jgi:hypothetical protein